MNEKNKKYPLLREPYSSELMYFKMNPQVAGMATEDEKVIFNPYSLVHPKGSDAIYKNESSRLFLKKQKTKSKFSITEEQKKLFKDYGEEQDIRDTIISRILSGDDSSGEITKEQREYADWVEKKMDLQGY